MSASASASAAPPGAANAPVPRGYRTWVALVQGLIVVGWAMYVLYLPGLLKSAGIDARLAIAILMLDQAIFAACDWAAGAYADRLTGSARRLGPAVTAVALVSSAAMLALPTVARLASPAALIATIVVWTAASSALRAPVFALLGRVSGIANKSGPVGMAFVGLSIASALTPLVTTALAGLDPALPLGIGAIALAAAALFATRIESRFPAPGVATGEATPASATRWVALVVLLAAIGMQVQTAILSKPAYVRLAGPDANLWLPTFWIGFAFALPLAVRVARGATPLAHASIAILVGAAMLAVASRAPSLAVLVATQLVAGGAWGVLTTVLVSAALALGGASGTGTAAGMVFAALAMAALVRLGLVAAGIAPAPIVAWLPVVAWVAAGALLVARARTTDALLAVSDVRAIRAG
ncbi:hypothetical protein BURK1_02327 [Burkholderiales bacterium]|nr:hypothetical protein BURK1_02327 [Burkholderiales bacterium]